MDQAAGPGPPRPDVAGVAPVGGGEPGWRRVFSGGRWRDAAVYRAGHLHEGLHIDGPAIVELPDTTVVIGPQQDAEIDAFGHVVMRNR